MWHALIVRSNAAPAVLRRLTVDEGVDAFYPVRRRWRWRSKYVRGRPDGKVLRVDPLIPGYVFADLPAPVNWRRWLEASPHIAGVLGVNDSPRPLVAAEVECLRGMGDDAPPEQAHMETHHEFQAGDLVQITRGALQGGEGRVERIEGRHVDLLLQLFGSTRPARIEAHRLARAG